MSSRFAAEALASPAPAGPGALAVRLLHPDARAPRPSREGDAGFDLRCVEPFALEPGGRCTVATGIAIALPAGLAGLVLPRSGLAAHHGITTLNSPGLIDPNYRGEIRVILHNTGSETYEGRLGDRIAQLLLVGYAAPEAWVVDRLPPAAGDRGTDGFGSSGR